MLFLFHAQHSCLRRLCFFLFMCLCIRATLLLDPGCAYSVSLQPDFVSRLPTVVLSHAHALWAMVQVRVCVCVCVLCEPPARLCQPLANCGLVTRTRAVGHGADVRVCVCAYSVSLRPDFVSRLPTVVLSHAHALWAMVQVSVCVCVCVRTL